MISPGAFALAVIAVLGASPAPAAGPPGATSCTGCHMARGDAGGLLPPLQGRPADEIMAAMTAFRSGERSATLMNRIAAGFTDGEMRAIANWLAAQGTAP